MFIKLTRPQGDKLRVNYSQIVVYQPSDRKEGTFICFAGGEEPKIVRESVEEIDLLIIDAMKGH